MPSLSVIDLGRVSYSDALALQMRLVEQIKSRGDDCAEGYLILVEHDPPVITLGKAAKPQNVVADEATLAGAGIEVHHVTRGGDVTYHGPGQIVGYPIINLRALDSDVRAYVARLEETLIRLLGRFGIEAFRRKGLTGVWALGQSPLSREKPRETGDSPCKIAAIGVAVSRWVTYHGFALNVDPNLAHFDLIVPCGIADAEVTSMAAVLGQPITTAEVKPVLIECFQEVFCELQR
ncbi:MAG: lipoyl(octanoyl) transferase LipB [Planctomycetaceae bacterium]|nr:lipoyl(octanoyl) transferase LipB [Planctomycetaceae bacterium]